MKRIKNKFMDSTVHGIINQNDNNVEYLRSIEVLPVKRQEFGYEDTLAELKKVDGVDIVHQDVDTQRIIAKIDSYNASCRIGSQNWCISSVIYGGSLGNANGIQYWNVYLRNPDHRQYFVWDFKQPSTSWVLVGTTTDEVDNEFYCAYNFPNHGFDMENYISENDWDRTLFFENDKKEV